MLPAVTHPNVLVGTETGDDAAVYRLDDKTGLVLTVDFFTPIVDDPYDFGRISAANSLSDVYAMGGQPLAALNVVGFPKDKLPMEVLGQILKGGADKASEAGCPVVGGHTVDDPELKYGMCVIGRVDPWRTLSNKNARAGDKLILTKPLGTGILSTAIKRQSTQGMTGLIDEVTIRKITELMAMLNREAAEAALAAGVHAATDVTGFGLLGHLRNIVNGSRVGARVHASAVPVLPEVWPLIEKGVVPGGSKRNQSYAAEFVTWHAKVTPAMQVALADAQTSGGLLLCCPPDRVADLIADLKRRKTPVAVEIGQLVEGDPKITVTET